MFKLMLESLSINGKNLAQTPTNESYRILFLIRKHLKNTVQ